VGYFPDNTIEVMEGGIESGFHHVEARVHPVRLLHVKGNRQNVRVSQVATSGTSLNSGDAFILDQGMTLIQWNGKQASLFEKMRAGQVVRAIKDERGGNPEAYIYEEGDKGLDAFWAALGGQPASIKNAREGGDDGQSAQAAVAQVKLYRLSDAKGTMAFTLEKSGDISKQDLDSKDAFILDNGSEVFVWIGKQSSPQERKLGMQYAEQYLQQNGRPPFTPISRVIEGGENAVFDLNFSGGELSRDLDFDAIESGGKAPCCPHYPDNQAHQASAVSQLAAQRYAPGPRGGRPPGAGAQANRPPVDIQRASNDAFSVFKNKERMAGAGANVNAGSGGGLYRF